MTISFKDAVKFFGISIVVCCAAFVCNMFLNYDADLRSIEPLIEAGAQRTLYDALIMNDIVVCAVSGGCLILTSVVMLIFYIGQYIEANSPKFGILKALGYGNFKIALPYALFGLSVLLGAAVGVGLSWAVIPTFYAAQNADHSFVEVPLKFHAAIPILIIALPTVIFGALSVLIALAKLKMPALALIKGNVRKEKAVKIKERESGRSFLSQLSLNVLNERKSLAFFIAFGSFCFSAMIQMSASMPTYTKNEMMGTMMLIIGLVLAGVSLYLAMSTVINCNKKKLAMLKIMGYKLSESGVAVLGLYRIPAYIGFAVGSAYQYGLLAVMINVVFTGVDNVPAYSFDWKVFGICLAAFAVVYELLTLIYTLLIGRTNIKSVMLET